MRIFKKAEISFLGKIILVLIILVIIIFVFLGGWWPAISNINPFVRFENTNAIKNSCELACIDNEKQEYCEKSRELRLGGGKVVKGTCASISQISIKGFDGVTTCSKIACETTLAPDCYENRKKIDCKKFSENI